MNIDALSFLSDELPENWEKVLEREKTIRNQHMIDVENVARRSFETGTISKYTPVRTLMSHFLPDIIKYVEDAVKRQDAGRQARRSASCVGIDSWTRPSLSSLKSSCKRSYNRLS